MGRAWWYVVVLLLVLVDTEAKSGKKKNKGKDTDKKPSQGAMLSLLNQEHIMPYKGKHKGDVGVVLCSGPSLDRYQHEGKDKDGRKIVVLTSNMGFKAKVPVDYLFVSAGGKGKRLGDGSSYRANAKAMNDFRPRAAKFFSNHALGPGAAAAGDARAKLYDVDPRVEFQADVGHRPFGTFHSAAGTFVAMQFALYAGMSRLYLVGCDASGSGYSRHTGLRDIGPAPQSHFSQAVKEWKAFKLFVGKKFPEAQVTVLNPVGLKGLGWLEAVGLRLPCVVEESGPRVTAETDLTNKNFKVKQGGGGGGVGDVAAAGGAGEGKGEGKGKGDDKASSKQASWYSNHLSQLEGRQVGGSQPRPTLPTKPLALTGKVDVGGDRVSRDHKNLKLDFDPAHHAGLEQREAEKPVVAAAWKLKGEVYKPQEGKGAPKPVAHKKGQTGPVYGYKTAEQARRDMYPRARG